jgi:hypothetical protein
MRPPGRGQRRRTPWLSHGVRLGDPSAELRANFDADGPVQLFSLYQSL